MVLRNFGLTRVVAGFSVAPHTEYVVEFNGQGHSADFADVSLPTTTLIMPPDSEYEKLFWKMQYGVGHTGGNVAGQSLTLELWRNGVVFMTATWTNPTGLTSASPNSVGGPTPPSISGNKFQTGNIAVMKIEEDDEWEFHFFNDTDDTLNNFSAFGSNGFLSFFHSYYEPTAPTQQASCPNGFYASGAVFSTRYDAGTLYLLHYDNTGAIQNEFTVVSGLGSAPTVISVEALSDGILVMYDIGSHVKIAKIDAITGASSSYADYGAGGVAPLAIIADNTMSYAYMPSGSGGNFPHIQRRNASGTIVQIAGQNDWLLTNADAGNAANPFFIKNGDVFYFPLSTLYQSYEFVGGFNLGSFTYYQEILYLSKLADGYDLTGAVQVSATEFIVSGTDGSDTIGKHTDGTLYEAPGATGGLGASLDPDGLHVWIRGDDGSIHKFLISDGSLILTIDCESEAGGESAAGSSADNIGISGAPYQVTVAPTVSTDVTFYRYVHETDPPVTSWGGTQLPVERTDYYSVTADCQFVISGGFGTGSFNLKVVDDLGNVIVEDDYFPAPGEGGNPNIHLQTASPIYVLIEDTRSLKLVATNNSDGTITIQQQNLTFGATGTMTPHDPYGCNSPFTVAQCANEIDLFGMGYGFSLAHGVVVEVGLGGVIAEVIMVN